MLRIDLQFYAFFVTVISGAALGFSYDVLRVVRRVYGLGRWTGSAADLIFWVVATFTLASGMFFANWAEIRFFVLVGMLIGIVAYFGLASPLVRALLTALLGLLNWVVASLVRLLELFVWRPVVALVGLVLSALALVGRFLGRVGRGLVRMTGRLGRWLLRPLRGPSRWVRLHYLLTKRRLRRWFRR